MSTQLNLAGLFNTVRQQKRKLRVAIHDGVFHIDEALCLAMLKFFCDLVNIQMDVKRTRDITKVALADIAIDVGMKYDPDTFRFDHHQKGGAGKRPGRSADEEGISYSSIGLFWLNFGQDFCKAVLEKYSDVKIAKGLIQQIAQRVDRQLIEGICAIDTGDRKIRSNGVVIPMFASIFSTLNPVQISYGNYEELQNEALRKSMTFLQDVLIGSVMRAADTVYHKPIIGQILRKTAESQQPRILILETASQAWRGMVGNSSPILVVIQPQLDGQKTWGIIATSEDCEAKFEFPEEWRGVQKEELQRLTDVGTATFCHDTGFFACAETKDDAILLALLALYAWDDKKRAEAKKAEEEEHSKAE